jgi:glutathione S-transferase
VIKEYIDDAYPEPRLRPAEAAARARMRLWTKQPDEGVHFQRPKTNVLATSFAGL